MRRIQRAAEPTHHVQVEYVVAGDDEQRHHQRAEQHADGRRQPDPQVVDAADHHRQRQYDGEEVYRLERLGHGCGMDFTGAGRIESRRGLCPRHSLFATQTRPRLVGLPDGSCLMSVNHGPLRVGVGGPVGSGKTALMDALCKWLRDSYEIAAITNDIYTKWDAEYLVRSGALPAERIAGVETGGCPHTAIREDASANLAAVADMRAKFPNLDLVLIESGGDNLAATFSPELADLTIYVIDVAAGEKIPSKGGPGITRSDLLVINKMDLAPYVGASLENMERDTKRMRGARPFIFSNLREGKGVDEIARFIEDKGGLGAA